MDEYNSPYNGIPECLKSLDRWHVWRLIDGQKIPVRSDKTAPAKSNNPDDWSPFDVAVEASDVNTPLALQLGMPDSDFPLVGIDFDNCFQRNDDGTVELRQWAKEVFDSIYSFAYIEVSPSKNGMKAILKGRKPEGCRSVFKFGPEKEQLEIYDNRRFWCMTGDVVVNNLDPEIDQTPWIEHVLEGMLPTSNAVSPRMSSTQPKTSSAAVPLGGIGPIPRADAYLTEIGDPGVGDRNNKVFKAAGHVKAFGLTDPQVHEIIQDWVSQWVEPLSQHEVDRTVRSALSSPTLPAAKEDRPLESAPVRFESMDDELTDDDYLPILDRCSGDLPSIYDADKQIDPAIYEDGGFIEAITSVTVSRMEEKHHEYGLAAALHLTSLALARQYTAKTPFTTYANLMSMVVGYTGTGKETPRQVIKQFLHEAEWSTASAMDTVDSGQAIAERIIETPIISATMDEFGDTLRMMAAGPGNGGYLQKIGQIMKMLYTGSADASLQVRNVVGSTKKNSMVARPSLHVVATMTPDSLQQGITEDQVEGGLVGRFLTFCCNDQPEIGDVINDEFPQWAVPGFQRLRFGIETINPDYIPLDLLEELRVASPDDPHQVPIDDDALSRLKLHFSDIKSRNRAVRTDPDANLSVVVWGRAAEKTSKFAMLFAASRSIKRMSELRITLDDANRAVKLSNHLARRMIMAIENRKANQYGQLIDDIHRWIHSKGRVKLRTFYSKFLGVDPRQRDSALADLSKAGKIFAVDIRGEQYLTVDKPN